MTRTYPDIYHPHSIAAIRKLDDGQNFPALPVKSQPPSEPQPFPRNILLGLSIVTLIASLATQSLEVFGVMALITLGCAGFSWFSYGDRHRKFEKAIRQHELNEQASLREYEEKCRNFEVINQENRLNKLAEILAITKPQDGQSSSARRGWSENDFFRVLKEYFPGKIYQGYTLQNPEYENGFAYTADFCYRDAELNLYIDIEIDEPYAYKSEMKLTHCLENQNEQKRNQYFLKCGWFIIRFAEEQVVRYPKQCCKVIAELAWEITREPINPDFENIPRLTTLERWTIKKANELRQNQYRNTYLNGDRR